MLTNRVSRTTLCMLLFLALYAIACQSFAMDASPSMTGMPGEASMTKWVRFIFGPLAYMCMSVGIVATTLNAVGAIDLGKGLWGMVGLVVFGGILLFSQQFMTTLFTGATVPAGGILAHEVVVYIGEIKK